MSTSSTVWTGTKKAVAGALMISVMLIAFVLFSHSVSNPQPVMKGMIPIPFGSNGSVLQGSITLFGQRNGINVYEVEFNHAEPFEHLSPNKIYLVRVPNGTGVSDVPLDLSLTLTGTGGHLVDYYGYRYTDAAGTVEQRDIAATRFKDRFPGQFFASQTARNGDIAHGRSLSSFEAAKNVTFLPTNGSLGSVRLDPAGALYVFVVNAVGGADLRVRGLSGCGNGMPDPGEQCDDGNFVNTDACFNNCTLGFPVPFDGGPTGSGISLTLTQFNGSSGAALAGATSIPLLRFTAIASDLTTVKHLAFVAETGSLTNLEHFRLWQDTNNDGVTDLPITLSLSSVGNRVVFESPINWSGALVLSHSSTTFELKADVPTGLFGTKSVRVGFAQSETDFVGGKRNAGTFPLFGIKKNGVCTTQICQIVVTTGVSPLWTLRGASSSSSSSANSSTSSVASSTLSMSSVASSASSASSVSSISSLASSTSSSSSSSSANSSTSSVASSTLSMSSVASSASSASSANSSMSSVASSTSSASSVASLCGNGTIESGETCDDHNKTTGDGCSSTCTVEANFSCTKASPSVCITYNAFVKALADTNNNGTVSDNEALLLTLDLADAPSKPYDTVKKFDINQDGAVDNTDVTVIFAELDILAP